MITITTIFIRAITQEYSAFAEIQVQDAIRSLLNAAGICNVQISPLVRYWKSQDQGESTCQFQTDIPLKAIQKRFADTWLADAADSRWSSIYLPSTSFLWISD